ncbi:Hypothetical protein A7982_05952 [Minicystis rosea]|nr:Hypothetical protein A7982_05952 [Minicystis rosea]
MERQRNVGGSLDEHFKSKPKYNAEVTRSAHAVIEATKALGRGDDMPLFTIDSATDSVLSAIYRVEQSIQKGLVATIVSLGPEQQAQLDAAELIDTTWFPDGIGFIHGSAGIQHAAMASIRSSLTDAETGPAIKAAVETLGLGPLVAHFLSHATLYAKKLGLAGEAVTDGEPRDPSDVWHDAFMKLAIDVMSAYRDDPAKQKTLLGSYESQLAEHRAELSKSRKRAEKKAKAEAAKRDGEAKNDAAKKSDS